MVDARVLQTQSVLAEAILELAGTKPVAQVSVAELTRRAGINRATFYDHFSSPGELLASVATSELDAVRDLDHQLRAQGERSPRDITRSAVRSVVVMIDTHRDTFALALLDARDASLHRGLIAHLQVSCQYHVETYVSDPTVVGREAVVARFVAEGIIGGIESWLASPTMTVDEVTDAILIAMPAWW